MSVSAMNDVTNQKKGFDFFDSIRSSPPRKEEDGETSQPVRVLPIVSNEQADRTLLLVNIFIHTPTKGFGGPEEGSKLPFFEEYFRNLVEKSNSIVV